jgi:adenosylhomocysteine nucleosidase
VFYEGKLNHIPVVIVESGIGQEKAASATRALLDIFCPEFIISAGYAGGLVPELKRFNIQQPELLLRKFDGAIIDVSNNKPQVIKKNIGNNKSASEPPEIESQNIVTKNRCTLVTVDQPVKTATQKLSLGKTSGAGLVDMETFAVAEVCANWKNENDPNKIIRFNAVRIILDAAEDELPKEVQQIMQSYEHNTARLIGTTLGSFFKRPAIIFDLYSLKERALQAADILAKHIAANVAANKYQISDIS